MRENKIQQIVSLSLFLVLFLSANRSEALNKSQSVGNFTFSGSKSLVKWTEVSNRNTRLILNNEKGYSLEQITYDKAAFDCTETGGFPVFKFVKGKETFLVSSDNQDLISRISSEGKNHVSVVYDYFGSRIIVSYRLLPQGIDVEFKVLKEKDYKFISVQSKEGLILVSRDSLRDVKVPKIIAPARQGLQIGFTDEKGIYFSSKDNPFGLWNSIDSFGGWVMNANFVSMIKDGVGMVVRPNEHSCKFLYGIKGLFDKEYLFIDVPHYFRPIETSTDQIPLLHKSLGMEILFCGDENKDNEINWVDIGIFYRDKYIKFPKDTDKDIKEALVGKLHAGSGYYNLLEGIKKMNFAPQVWWLTGAHVAGGSCYDQNWWVFRPVADYGDYFKFKQEASECGARIGVHQNLDDVYQDEGWNPDEIRKMPNGELWKGGIWGGRQAYLRDINQIVKNRKIYNLIDDWFSVWDVKRGDAWHYDVLAAIELMENYDLANPATKETDFDSRYNILKYVAERKGVKISSEMTTEGLHEYLAFGLHNPCYYHYSEVPASIWKVVEEIPLYPVLFLGRAYVGDLERPAKKDTLSYAQALLVGTKRVKWFGVISPEDAQDVYFKQNLFWSQICDLSVVDVNREGNRFTTAYSDNSELTVDLGNNAFVYKKNGITYDGFSPFNSWGYMGVWTNPYSVSVKEGNYVRSITKDAGNKCVFYPDGRMDVEGSYSRGNLAILQKSPLTVHPEKKLTVELIDEKMLDGGVKYTFKIETEERQFVTMYWQGNVDWFDEDGNVCVAKNKNTLKMEISDKSVISVESE